MATQFFRFKSYFNYWLDAVDEHSLHSPFFFDFYKNVVGNKSNRGKIDSIEKLRQQLLDDKRILKTTDLGSRGSQSRRTIGSIAKKSVSRIQASVLYSNVIEFANAKTILELGTCLGINTLYLAQKKDAKVVTFEGSPELADIARLTFEFAGAGNIELIEGNLDTTLSTFLQSLRKIDFVLIDANHRYTPTLNYFNLLLPKLRDTSILIFDDIHYSNEMERAWDQIKRHQLVYATADLYHCGIVFFDPSLNKQHVILQY